MPSVHRNGLLLGVALAMGIVFAGCSSDNLVDNNEALVDETHEPAEAAEAPVETQPPIAPDDRTAMPPFVPYEAIVKFRASADAKSRATLAETLHIEDLTPETSFVRFTPEPGTNRMAPDPIAETWRLIDELGARDDIEYAHPNWQFELSATPNDPQYAKQWHYPAIQLPAAWDLTTGSSTVRIAILDTGRTSHPDLAGKWLSGVEYDAANQDGNAAGDPSNTWRHGVHVASIAGGSTNNGSNSAGVCQNCQLLNVKVAQGNSIYLANVMRGIRWAVDNGARVINMSFEANGVPCSNSSMAGMYDAANYAASRNVTMVAAAGNRGGKAGNTVPASCPGVIAVAATDPNNTLAAYSNRGAVTLAAPGGAASLVNSQIGTDAYGAGLGCPADPSSAFGASTQGVVANWTTSSGAHCDRYLSGTSMAAPHVAGVVGLMLSRNPALTPSQIRSILQSTATPLSSCGGMCGAGLLNALSAVQQAAPLPVNDPKPVPQMTVQCNGLDCTFNGSGSTDNLGIVSYEWILPGQQFKRGSVVNAFMPGYAGTPARLRVTDNRGQSSEITRTISPTQPNLTPTVGHYYNPNRPGNGLDVYETPNGGYMVLWYTYETYGTPVWYISDVAARNGARWTQVLYRVTWNGTNTTLATVGTVSLDFSHASTVWFSWVLNGVSGGERYTYLYGGQGRSGAWYVPTESGWGIQVQESGTSLDTIVAFYDGSEPRWMKGSTFPTSNATFPLSYYNGIGLCPSCGGTAAPVVNYDWDQSSMNLQIANGSSTTGYASTNIKVFYSFSLHDVWVRSQQALAILTKP